MKHRWAALVFVLALLALVPTTGTAQDSTPARSRERTPGLGLGQNYPNPFNPTTTIPFTIGDQPCTDSGRRYRVSLRIYNVLAQLVAVPILQGGDEAAGQPVENLQLGCGAKSAFWNGNYLNGSREVASGIYLYRLEVDGRAVVKKMIVIK
ncbi:MAG: T9SS type A sorting domain-containing protein [Gemmatimonadota bacterium]|nr:T9SS type A sorting domain-containing protein [Gemmatimonadota bacterium]